MLNKRIDNGYDIKNVYDVGAHTGAWSNAIKSKILPNSNFYLFEANAAYVDKLEASGNKFFNVILSSKSKTEVDFYFGTDTGDSYFKENSPNYYNINPIRVSTSTLSEIINIYNLPVPNFIKIDTQGSELDILDGLCGYID